MLVSPSLLHTLPLARKDSLEPSTHETHTSSALAISDVHPADIGQTREILVVAAGDGMEIRDNVMVRILKSPERERVVYWYSNQERTHSIENAFSTVLRERESCLLVLNSVETSTAADTSAV